MSIFNNNLNVPKDMRPSTLDLDASTIEVYIETAKAISRTTYKSLYVIDYTTMGFLYVSSNPIFLCGKSSDEVQKQGYDFYAENVPEEDLKFLNEINQAGFKFLSKIPIEERLLCTIFYSFHLKTVQQGRTKLSLISHKLTPLRLDEYGNMHLALCVVSLPENHNAHISFITMEGYPTRWEYIRSGKRWKEIPNIILSDDEKAVIALSQQGMMMQEIATKINKSIDTVKFYKRGLFQKLGVSNISEAIAYATHHRLI